MLARIIFSITNLIKYRKNLKKVSKIDTILKINKIHLQYIDVLVLDFDGVLASHGKNTIDNENIKQWLKNIKTIKPNIKIFILSNKPSKLREKYFNKNFPEFIFFRASKKKPYPNGLNEIQQQTKISPNNILLIDDRLATGMLATILANTKGILITKPLQDFKFNFIAEVFFHTLRILEKLLL